MRKIKVNIDEQIEDSGELLVLLMGIIFLIISNIFVSHKYIKYIFVAGSILASIGLINVGFKISANNENRGYLFCSIGFMGLLISSISSVVIIFADIITGFI